MPLTCYANHVVCHSNIPVANVSECVIRGTYYHVLQCLWASCRHFVFLSARTAAVYVHLCTCRASVE